MTQSWEALRKEARRLETVIDGKLVDYSKLAANLQSASASRTSFDASRPTNEGTHATPFLPTQAHGLTPCAQIADGRLYLLNGDEAVQRRGTTRDTQAAEDMTSDMDALLTQLSSVIESMSTLQASPSIAHTLQRHTEILHDYSNEFRKTRASITSLREHAELLSGAADRPRVVTAGGGTSLDGLYKERASIAAATSGADTAIATGMNLKEDLDRQRAMFASMVERMETMSEGIPAVNRLIGQIRRKKKRDVLIMAAVVSVLLFITFSWKVMH